MLRVMVGLGLKTSEISASYRGRQVPIQFIERGSSSMLTALETEAIDFKK